MVRVMYFSIVREKVGKAEELVEFRGSVGELREKLAQMYPQIRDMLTAVRFAVNEEYVKDDFYLRGDETVALIPPVSGG
ncbi:MAG TPA: molybdopterin converting factor subunit 1 [Aquifex aeolicus]|nr:molybdopterin converting factor subunit 1 [Aquifex aeolicus]